MNHNRRAGTEVSSRSGAILGWDRDAFEANRQAEIAYWWRGRSPDVPRVKNYSSWIGFSTDWHNPQNSGHYRGGSRK